MLARYRKAAALGLIAATTAVASWAVADGIYQTYPGVGSASFCASTVTGIVLPTQQGPYGIVPGSTQGNNVGICAQTVPAGPPVFQGTEHSAYDVNAAGATSNGAPPATATVRVDQLGQGAFVQKSAAAIGTGNKTIPNGTVWYYVDTTETNPTITFPSGAVEGSILHIVLGSGLTTGITTAAGASATACLPACGAVSGTTAGTGYAWRLSLQLSGVYDWVRFQ